MADLLMKQAIAVIDSRTTVICLHVAGQIRKVDAPFETLIGEQDDMPFHVHCRTMVMPWMPGFVNDLRKDANAELMRRPLKTRRIGPDGEIGGSLPPKAGPPSPAPRPALAGMDAHGDLAKSYGSWMNKNLSEVQAEAWQRYTTTSAYQRWNPHLRGTPADVTEKDLEHIEAVRSMLEASPPLDLPIEVFRGLKDPMATFGTRKMAPGAVFRDDAFVSTTMDDEILAYYKGAEEGCAVTIHVPAGKKVGVAETEGQVVLQAGTEFRVVSDEMVTEITNKGDYDYLAGQGYSETEFEEKLLQYKVIRRYRKVSLEVI